MASRSDIEAGRAHVSVYAKTEKLLIGLDNVKDRCKALGADVMKVGGLIAGVGVAILTPLAGALAHFTQTGAELNKVSQRTGIAASALGELKFAAEQSGLGLGDVEAASKQITKTLADAQLGAGGAHVALSRLGLTADELKKQLPDQQLQTIASRIAAIKDPALQAAMAAQLLGNANLAPLARNLAALRQEARDLNLVPTDKAVADAAKLNNAVGKIFSVLRATVFEVGAALAPMLIPAAETVAVIASAVTDWVRQNQWLIRTIAIVGAGLVGVGGAIAAVGALIYGLGLAFGAVAAAGAALIGGGLVPMIAAAVAIAAAVGGATFAWLKFTDTGRATATWLASLFGELGKTMRTTLGGIGDALRAGNLQLAAQIAVTGIQLAFAQGVDAISRLIGGQLGDTFSTIASKVIKGDFMGAWQSALKQLSAWHAQITEGITAMWTMGARAAVDAWQTSVNTITDSLLKASADGGILGKFASTILGVDLQAEIGRGQDLDRRLGVDNGDQLAQAQADARNQNAAIAEGLRKKLDEIDLAAQANTDAADDAVAAENAKPGGLVDELARLQAELAKMRGEAKEAALNVPKFAAGLPGAGAPDVVNPAALQKGFGTFSAAALLLGGNDNGANAKLERLAREQKRVAEEQREEAKKAVAKLGGVVEGVTKLIQQLQMK